VRRYLLNVARYWIEQGADGWRLDVPNEINDDSFWTEFREVVYNANPEAYTVGEIWEANPRWANDQHFDGLMNYPVRIAIQQFIDGKITAAQFSGQVESFLALYPRENGYAMYNLLGSHDTERILTFFNYDQRKVKLAFLFLFTYPGVPSIYYGDEIGLRGGKDPDCRGAFPWDQSQWAEDLHSWVKQLVALRRKTAVLRRGDFQPLVAQENSQVYAFIRAEGNERVLVVLNAAETPATLRIPFAALGNATGHPLHSLLDQRPVVSEGDNITVALEPFSGDILA
jgi:glycosidase